jgi:hypothetical protein
VIVIATDQYPQRHCYISVGKTNQEEDVAHRFSMSDRNPRCNRTGNDSKERHTIRNNDSNMPPSIRQQLRDSERRQLAVARPEAKKHMRYNGLRHGTRGTSHNSSNKDEYMARNDKVAPAEEVAVGAADHEGDCDGGDEDGSDPVLVQLRDP